MANKNFIMSQLVFKFPFKKKYYEQDFYVSSNNFSAYRLVEGWPNWPGKWVNVYGAKGSGKTHLSKILEKKIDKLLVINENQITNKTEFQTLRKQAATNAGLSSPPDSFMMSLVFPHIKSDLENKYMTEFYKLLIQHPKFYTGEIDGIK